MEKPMYPGEVTDENISAVFAGAGDFVRRVLRCGDHTLFIYSIDGLTSGADTSEYVIKPILEQLRGMTVQKLYDRALYRVVVNSVAKPCENLDDVALLLVNGFCVVLFPEVGALAFEVKTGEKRSMTGPE